MKPKCLPKMFELEIWSHCCHIKPFTRHNLLTLSGDFKIDQMRSLNSLKPNCAELIKIRNMHVHTNQMWCQDKHIDFPKAIWFYTQTPPKKKKSKTWFTIAIFGAACKKLKSCEGASDASLSRSGIQHSSIVCE